MDWHNTILVGDIAGVSLDCWDERFEVIGKALVESGLCPVYSEVPISWALEKTCVLLKGSAGNSSLQLLIVYRELLGHRTCFSTCAKRRPADPSSFRNCYEQCKVFSGKKLACSNDEHTKWLCLGTHLDLAVEQITGFSIRRNGTQGRVTRNTNREEK